MADISLYTGIGRLTRDAELRTVPSGKSVLQFTIASNPSWNRDDPALFLDCQLWGERGSRLGEFLKKGTKVCVNGTLKQDAWTATDGTKKSKFRVDLSYVSLLDPRKSDGDPEGPDGAPQGYKASVQAQVAALFGDKDARSQSGLGVASKPEPVTVGADSFDDDIPF